MAQPPGCAFHSNFFFLLLFFLLSFLQTSVPALPALPKVSPALGSRESLFFLTVPWANIWFAFPHFLLHLPSSPSQGPVFTSHHFTAYFSPQCPMRCPPALPSPVPLPLAQGQWLGSSGWEEKGAGSECLLRELCRESQQNLPWPLLSRSPQYTSQKTFLPAFWPGWTKREWVELVNHQFCFLELSRGGQEGSAPPPSVDTHTRTHGPVHINTQKAKDRATPRVGTLRPFSWIE